jgi:hypothetical protein
MNSLYDGCNFNSTKMRILAISAATALIIAASILTACSGGDSVSLSLQQRAAKILDEGSVWGGSGNVEVLASPSGVDFSDLLEVQITFTTSGTDDWAPTFFETSGADDFISADGATWFWTGSGTDNITLNDASVAELTSVAVTETAVTFSFEVTPDGGRVSGIDGSYTIRLN